MLAKTIRLACAGRGMPCTQLSQQKVLAMLCVAKAAVSGFMLVER